MLNNPGRPLAFNRLQRGASALATKALGNASAFLSMPKESIASPWTNLKLHGRVPPSPQRPSPTPIILELAQKGFSRQTMRLSPLLPLMNAYQSRQRNLAPPPALSITGFLDHQAR